MAFHGSRQNANFGVKIPVKTNISSQPTDAFVQQKKVASPSKVASVPHFGKIVDIVILDEAHGSEKDRKNKLDNLLGKPGKTLNAEHVIRGHFEDVDKTIGIFFDTKIDPLEGRVMSILDDDSKSFAQKLKAINALK